MLGTRFEPILKKNNLDMENETITTESTPTTETPKKPDLFKKILIIGVPILLVQIVVVYFLVSKLVAPAVAAKGNEVSEEVEHLPNQERQMYVLKDLIINPAASGGTKFLLTTIGVELPSTEALHEIQNKEVVVRDILNTVLGSKHLEELSEMSKRDVIRKEILTEIAKIMKFGKPTNIYFSKFIIQ